MTVPYDPGLPQQWRDVESATVVDVFDVASGLHNITESFRDFFADDAWSRALDDPERERLFLAQLALAGAFLARLSMFIDDTARDREEMREIHVLTMAEIRARKQVRQRGDAGGGVRAVVARVPEPADVGLEGART